MSRMCPRNGGTIMLMRPKLRVRLIRASPGIRPLRPTPIVR